LIAEVYPTAGKISFVVDLQKITGVG